MPQEGVVLLSTLNLVFVVWFVKMYFLFIQEQIRIFISLTFFGVRCVINYTYMCLDSTSYVFWQVVPSIHGIYFKDLKQTLKKEQCDVSMSAGICG